MKKFFLLVPILLFSCSNITNQEQKNIQTKEVVFDSALSTLDLGNKTGANINIKFNFSDGNFKTKASVNGTPAKTGANISTVKVYLIEANSTGAGTDPLSSTILAGTPITLNKTGNAFNLLFKNVAGQVAGKDYYVGVMAFDGANTPLIKLNNAGTSWTGTTATNPNFALSTNSLHVDQTTLAVTPANGVLTVTPNLLDAIGAQLDTSVTSNNGTNIVNSAGNPVIAQ